MIFKFIKNSCIVLVLVCLGYSPIFYFNIWEDPYSIFTSDFNNRRIEPNSHFIKARFICNNPKLFNSFIFGNSRANNIYPKIFTNGNYFNLYYSLGVPKEYLNDIQLFLSKDVEIKNIILCLDYSSYMTSSKARKGDMLRTPYTTDKIKLIKTYINYAFYIPNKKFKEEYYNSKPSSIYSKMFETGQAENKEIENFIEQNKLTHINDQKFTKPIFGYEFVMEDVISQIDSIKNICNTHKINLKIVLNPIHKVTYLANSPEKYFVFLKMLSEISDFYDFSGINKVTSNNYFYYETSHFRPLIGSAMANFIQSNKRIDTIPEFGNYISRQNINQHLSILQDQLKQ